jgi:hypothetical protein
MAERSISSLRTSPSRCTCRCAAVRLGLVVVEVADEVLDLVLGEELAELGVELRGERLVVGKDRVGRLTFSITQASVGLPVPVPQGGPGGSGLADAVDQSFDRPGLVPVGSNGATV